MVPPMSRSPATTSSWSAIVAITGSGVLGSNSALFAPARPARSRATSMTMHCRPRQRPRSGILCSRAYRIAPILPSMPRTPKPPGIRMPSTPVELAGRVVGVLAVVAGHPADRDLGVVAEAARLQRLGRRQVRVGQVDVLADQGDGDRAGRAVHPPQQVIPGSIQSTSWNGSMQPAARRRRRGPRRAAPSGCRRWTGRPGWTTTASSSTSHIRQILRLRPSLIGRSLRATIASGWMPMDRSAATECCVGLVFSSPHGPMYGSSETWMKKQRSRPISWRIWRIASRNGRRLDVADRAADLGDDDVHVRAGHGQDAGLDLVGDVRDDLHRVAQVLAPRRSLAITLE